MLAERSGDRHGEFTLHKVVCHFCGLHLAILFIQVTTEGQLFQRCIRSAAECKGVDKLKNKTKTVYK